MKGAAMTALQIHRRTNVHSELHLRQLLIAYSKPQQPSTVAIT